MKKGFLLLIVICSMLSVQAQQDSIRVVIECDSLYRPFLDSFGNLEVTVVSEEFNFKIGKTRFFKVPIPRDSTYNYLDLQIKDFWSLLTGWRYAYNKIGYKTVEYDPQTGLPIETKMIKYSPGRTLQILLPIDIHTDKYLIDNTCPKCSLNDNVSWIAYGLPMENPITGEFEMVSASFFNPYNNPFVLPHYLGGCEPGKYHWYCNRCRKEY